MCRRGKTPAGTQRWFCRFCKVTAIKKRKDTSLRHARKLFNQWIVGTATLSDIARKKRVTRQTIDRWFAPFWKEAAECPPSATSHVHWIMVDGIYIHKRAELVLIARTDAGEIFWGSAPYESSYYWERFFRGLPTPDIVICDGQKGLLKAIDDCWPAAKLQRCLFHVMQLATIRLTRKPKTDAGCELRSLMLRLNSVRAHEQKKTWIGEFVLWERRHETLLKERTYGDDRSARRWWYTHRNLRAARSLFLNAIPHLFIYLDYPDTPRTTNYVEGGLNARLAELITRHRGMRQARKRILAARFLAERSKKRSTRNVT
jgi:hypothetical protein